jgi:hypothetical protein
LSAADIFFLATSFLAISTSGLGYLRTQTPI